MANKNHILQNLTIANWNANGLKNKRATFIAFLASHSIDIACVTETHFINDEKFSIPGYKIYRQDRNAPVASGGTAIVIKKYLIHHEHHLVQLQHIEAVSIDLKLRNYNIKIISVYLQPNRRITENDIHNLFDEDRATLVLGDLNSKNIAWGCRVNNPNGVRLHNITSNHGIQVSAPNEPTYFPYRVDHQPDILDILLQKNFSKPIYSNVYIELDSDHLPVVYTFTELPVVNTPTPRLITGYVKWDTFKLNLNQLLEVPQLTTRYDIDDAIENLTKSITKAVNISTLSKRNPQRSDYLHPPERIMQLIKEKHKLRRLWQQTRLQRHKENLNALTHRVKWELDNHRYTSYQKYLADIDPGDATVWKATKRILKQPTIIPPLQINNEKIHSEKEKCQAFADHLESTFSLNENDDDFTIRTNEIVNNNIPADTTATDIVFTNPTEIKNQINQLPLKKSPGYDLIPNIVLKYLTPKALTIISSIFNRCMTIGYFPTRWKHAEIILFNKPGKNKTKPENYRPISLLTTLSKLFEKIILSRLSDFLQENSIIPDCQFGFRANHSTTHQILRIYEKITNGFENKQHTTIAFLDVAQAFDKVWLKGLLYKLIMIETPPYLLNTIASFISNRTFCVRINSCLSNIKQAKAGIPQGSILGPVLFNIFLHDIPHPPSATMAMYADDTAIITQHENIDTAAQALQEAIVSLQEYFKKWQITLNPSKCETKIFTLRRPQNPFNIIINNEEILWNPSDSAIKYLGVYLDKRLTWSYHINKKLNEAYARLSMLYPVINRKSSLKAKCASLIYQSILRPVITYGCIIWGTTSKTNLNKVQTFQNKILRIAVNAPWYMRNTQIHRELGIPTIEDFIKKCAKDFFKNINKCVSAVNLQLGKRTRVTRLKKRLPQDILISSSDSDE